MNNIILNKSINHLKQCEEIKDLIEKYPAPKFSPSSNYYEALAKSIIYQQLSGNAAKAIYSRFLNLFDGNTPIASEYLHIDDSMLRDIGISKQKISYIENLSIFFIENQNRLDFTAYSNEEISSKLISIKGIGQWTIDMFMIFTLSRLDVLPVGDLAIKKAFKVIYSLEELPSESFMKSKALKWKPYRSIASSYLWMLANDS